MRSEHVCFTNYLVFLLQHENKWIWIPLPLSSFSPGRRSCLFGPVACPCASRRKQLLTLPGRTLFESLSCSKELCCLILFFLNMFNVACWCCLLLPLVHCWVVQCLVLGKGAVQITLRIFHCVGVWARGKISGH